MSNNLIRKGLAVLATGSLVVAGLVGIAAPAQANASISLAPTTGTSLGMPITETLSLSTSLSTGLDDISNLKYKIDTDATFVAIATPSTGTVAGTAGYTKTAQSTGVGSTNYTNEVSTRVVAPTSPVKSTTNTIRIGVDSIPGAVTKSTGTAPVSTTASRTVTVTAWIDANSNDVIDSAEGRASVVVTFLPFASLTTEATVTPTVEGDTSVSGKFRFTNVNNEQLTNTEVGAHFKKGDGGALSSTEANVRKHSVAWSSTNWFSYTGTVDALPKNAAVMLQPLFVNGGNPAATNTVGTAVIDSSANRKLASFNAATVASKTALFSAPATSGTVNVALNSSYQVRAIGKDSSTPSVAVAGVPVTAMIESTRTLSSTVTVNVNGTTYTTNASLPGSVTASRIAVGNTDAKGEVRLSITTAGLTDGDDVVVTFYAENFTAVVTTNNEAKAYTAGTSAFILNAPDGQAVTVDGTAVSLQLSVVDQFGGELASGLAQANWVSSTQTTAATSASSTTSTLTNGSATLTITDNGTGAGVNVYDIKVLNPSTLATIVQIDATFDITIRTSATAVTPGELLLTTGGYSTELGQNEAKTSYQLGASAKGGSATADRAGLQYLDGSDDPVVFGGYDERKIFGDEPNIVRAEAVVLQGVVNTQSSATFSKAALANGSVTVSGAGLQFSATQTAKRAWGVGSLTFFADASGQFMVEVFSQKAGLQTVTFTAGGVSKTVQLYFAEAPDNKASKVTFTAPKSIKAGRTLAVTVNLTDTFGNPVSATGARLTMSYSGPGMTFTEPVATNSKGQAVWRVLLQPGDFGPAVITVNYTQKSTLVGVAAKDLVTATSATWVGPIANAKAGAKAGRVIVEAYRAKGKTVSVFVGSTRVASFVSNAADFSKVVRGIKSGTRNVSVRLSGPGEDFTGAIVVK